MQLHLKSHHKLDRRLKVVREEEKSGQLYEAQHTCTCTALISSDASDVEGDALTTRPVTWRTDDVSEYFVCLVKGTQLESHNICFWCVLAD